MEQQGKMLILVFKFAHNSPLSLPKLLGVLGEIICMCLLGGMKYLKEDYLYKDV